MNILLLGDIHGNFGVINDACERYGLTNTIIIQVGDFGLGFNVKREYKELDIVNSILEKHNNKLLVIRGNHCDPSYYKGTGIQTFNERYSNIELIKDGTIKHINDKKILFLGGALSIDRLFRTKGYNYWEDEILNIDFDKLEPCDMIISHTCCSYFSGLGGDIAYFLGADEHLEGDLENERLLMDKVANIVKPKEWYFGHFHTYKSGQYTNIDLDLDIRWKCIDINELYGLR